MTNSMLRKSRNVPGNMRFQPPVWFRFLRVTAEIAPWSRLSFRAASLKLGFVLASVHRFAQFGAHDRWYTG